MKYPFTRRIFCFVIFAIIATITSTTTVHAAPALSSRPGAAYTLYLDFDGFTFDGTWGDTGMTPTATTRAGTDSTISQVWARVAEKYAAFDINVTTIDPAVAAGRASSDIQRQAYYDSTPRVMHTVIGSSSSWLGVSAGGVSYADVMQGAVDPTQKSKTNWVFHSELGSTMKKIAEAIGHEDGHALGLSHQSDTNAAYSTNDKATGANSYAPIMGLAYSSQKGTWSVGTVNGSATEIQNDVAVILANDGMRLVDSGVGHSFADATALPLIGTSVNSALAGGLITPLIGQTPNPIGVDNYTKDYFKFTVEQDGNVSLTVTNAGDWITPGVAALGGTLRSRLNIFKASDLANAFGAGIETADASATTFSGLLTSGDYYAQITSYGGYQSPFDTQRRYYDMDSYTLSGTGFGGPSSVAAVVPETGTLVLVGLGLAGLVLPLRRKK